MIYFITAISHRERPLMSDKIDTRSFGYYENLITAFKAVLVNTGNMHECLYNYLVVEGIGEGIHALVEEDYWFKWNNDHWEGLCGKPECFNGLINWAIG